MKTPVFKWFLKLKFKIFACQKVIILLTLPSPGAPLPQLTDTLRSAKKDFQLKGKCHRNGPKKSTPEREQRKKIGSSWEFSERKVARSCEEPQMCAMGISSEMGQRWVSFFLSAHRHFSCSQTPFFLSPQPLPLLSATGENFNVISRTEKRNLKMFGV